MEGKWRSVGGGSGKKKEQEESRNVNTWGKRNVKERGINRERRKRKYLGLKERRLRKWRSINKWKGMSVRVG